MSDNLWEAQQSTTQTPEPRLIYEQITPIPAPLNSTFGAFDNASVPAALQDWLIPAAQREEDEIPVSNLYVVVDGTRVPDLEQRVDAFDGDARCLFTGKTAEEIGSDAPWLIRLQEGDMLLRELMSRGAEPVPWMMWENSPAIYVCSPLSFDDMWQHLRTFIALPDETERSMFFRFWDCRTLLDFLIAHEQDGADAFFGGVSSVVVFHSRECARLSWEGSLTGRKMRVTEQSRARYRGRRIIRQREAITDQFARLPEFVDLPASTLQSRVKQHHSSALQLGFTDSKDIFKIVLGLCLCHSSPDKQNWVQRVSENAGMTQLEKRNEVEKRLHLEIDAAKSRQEEPE